MHATRVLSKPTLPVYHTNLGQRVTSPSMDFRIARCKTQASKSNESGTARAHSTELVYNRVLGHSPPAGFRGRSGVIRVNRKLVHLLTSNGEAKLASFLCFVDMVL